MAVRAGRTPDQLSAEVLRKRLRIALKNARVKAGFTQKLAAEKLDWSISKVVRIEQGTVPVAPTDVRAMLQLFEVTEQARIDELVVLAREAREAKSWADYDDILSPAFRELIGSEAAASSIWKYEPSVVPGYFQTAEYAHQLLSIFWPTPTDLNRRAEVRSKRQEILDRANRPEFHVIIGEAALVRPVGDKAVMREQITHLIELSTQPGINLWLLPLIAGAHRGMGNAFTVLQFDDPDLDDSLYLEDAEKRSTARDEDEVIKSHLELFNQLRVMAEKLGSFEEHASRIVQELYDGANGTET